MQSLYSIAVLAAALLLQDQAPAPARRPAGPPAAAVASFLASATRQDLTGVWEKGRGPAPVRDAKGNICVTWCTKDSIPANRDPNNHTVRDFPDYKPALLVKVKQLDGDQLHQDPALRCNNPGLPRIGPPAKIVQTEKETIFLYDDLNGSFWRIIPTDGRPHRPDAEDSFLGDSIGRWDGPTFVVETNHFTDATWMQDNGALHTDKMKVVERLTRKNGELLYQATVEDPDVLAKPWVRADRLLRIGDKEPFEPPPCVEQSVDKEVGAGPDTYHTNPR